MVVLTKRGLVWRLLSLTIGLLAMFMVSNLNWLEAQERQVVEIVAERFSFTPSEIRVPVGTALELRIRSHDTMHGFRIVGRNVNITVPKRRQGEVVVLFEASEAGRFRFECSRLCGAGHNLMQGEIVVVEE
tara:strand:+ start:12385 stop:12777 length:393 start_codon:yes stop_codon:yes gene_type:complete